MKKVVTIGGGTGIFNLLMGLKKRDFEITALASMADSGGSNKIIRDEFGLLPTSDIRLYLIALSEEGDCDSSNLSPKNLDLPSIDCPRSPIFGRFGPSLKPEIAYLSGAGKGSHLPTRVLGQSSKHLKRNLLRELFMYRFGNGGEGIKGMTFGNLFMAALADILGDQMEAVQKTSDILKIKGKIIPITSSDSHLTAIYENGLKVKGEHNIDEPKHNGKLKIKKIYLDPPSIANSKAIKAIRKADLIVIGPGDLYTSLVVNFVVDGIAEAVKSAKAKVVYILNLMTSFGETYGLKASDHIDIVEKYSGRKLDYILLNSKKLPGDIIRKYEKENDYLVEDDLEKRDRRIIRADFLSSERPKKDKADVLKRSLIRHSGEKIAKAIDRLV